MRTLSKREHRVLAIGVLLAVILAFYVGAVRPYMVAFWDYKRDIGELQERLVRFDAIAATREDIVARLEGLRADLQASSYYLKDETAALASAELQQHVKRAVGDGGGRLLSTQSLNDPGQSGVRSTTLKVRMRGTSVTLLRVFHRLESGQPLMVLDNVAVQATGRGRNDQVGEEKLDIHFEITGFLRPSAV